MIKQVITVLLPAVGGCGSVSRASRPIKAHLYSAQKAEMDGVFCPYFVCIHVFMHVTEELTMTKRSNTTENHMGESRVYFPKCLKNRQRLYTGM